MSQNPTEAQASDETRFDVVYQKPFDGKLRPDRRGSWFFMPDNGEPDGALVWVEGDTLGWLSINNNFAFTQQFNRFRYHYKDQGMNAEQAFWSSYELATDSGLSVPISKGLLSEALAQYEEKTATNGTNGTNGDNMDIPANASFGVTLDEDDNVIELVRTDETGTFVRSAGEWVALDPDNEDDFEGIEDYEWVDVTSDVVDYFDANSQSNDLKRTDIAPFTA